MLDFMHSAHIEAHRQSIIELSALCGALVTLLVDKGVCTQEEIETWKLKVSAALDQQIAQQQEVAKAEFYEKHPGMKLFGKAMGLED